VHPLDPGGELAVGLSRRDGVGQWVGGEMGGGGVGRVGVGTGSSDKLGQVLQGAPQAVARGGEESERGCCVCFRWLSRSRAPAVVGRESRP